METSFSGLRLNTPKRLDVPTEKLMSDENALRSIQA